MTEFGELQIAVLNVLWKLQAASVHEVLAALPPERTVAYTTVLTVLRNLEKRGVVTHEEVEGARMFRYRPLVAAEETRTHLVHDLLERWFEGSALQLVRHLILT